MVTSMISAAVQFYDVVVFAHIVSVLVAFGPPLAYGMFAMTAQREGGGEAVPTVARAILAWDRGPSTIGMTLVLLTGIYLGADGPFGMGSFFVSWGFVAIIVLFGFVHGFFLPKGRKLIAIAERDLERPGGGFSPEFQALNAQMARMGALAGLIVILTIYVMTAKPFL